MKHKQNKNESAKTLVLLLIFLVIIAASAYLAGRRSPKPSKPAPLSILPDLDSKASVEQAPEIVESEELTQLGTMLAKKMSAGDNEPFLKRIDHAQLLERALSGDRAKLKELKVGLQSQFASLFSQQLKGMAGTDWTFYRTQKNREGTQLCYRIINQEMESFRYVNIVVEKEEPMDEYRIVDLYYPFEGSKWSDNMALLCEALDARPSEMLDWGVATTAIMQYETAEFAEFAASYESLPAEIQASPLIRKRWLALPIQRAYTNMRMLETMPFDVGFPKPDLAQAIEAVTEAYPADHPMVSHLLTLAFIVMEKPDLAQPHLDRMKEMTGNDIMLNQHEARIAMARGDYKRAVTLYEEFLAKRPNWYQAYFPFADLLLQLEDWQALTGLLTRFRSNFEKDGSGGLKLATNLQMNPHAESFWKSDAAKSWWKEHQLNLEAFGWHGKDIDFSGLMADSPSAVSPPPAAKKVKWRGTGNYDPVMSFFANDERRGDNGRFRTMIFPRGIKMKIPEPWMVKSEIKKMEAVPDRGIFDFSNEYPINEDGSVTLNLAAVAPRKDGYSYMNFDRIVFSDEFTRETASQLSPAEIDAIDREQREVINAQFASLPVYQISKWIGTTTEFLNGQSALVTKYRRTAGHGEVEISQVKVFGKGSSIGFSQTCRVSDRETLADTLDSVLQSIELP